MRKKLLTMMALAAMGFAVVPAQAQEDGTYYLQETTTGAFMSRGEAWGTEAVVDAYGTPVTWSSTDKTLIFLDSDAKLFVPEDGGSVYTDYNNKGSYEWALSAVDGGGYKLQCTGASKYVKLATANTIGRLTTADAETDAAVWKLLTKDEYDAILKAYPADNMTNVITAAGLSGVTSDNFVSTLTSDYKASDMTSKIGTAQFSGSIGDWTMTVVRTQSEQPVYGNGFTEVWSATGTLSQSITGLNKGIYKVTVQGFCRANGYQKCYNMNQSGYQPSTSYLAANGEQVQLKPWVSGATVSVGDDGKITSVDPNNTTQAVAAFTAGKYNNEVYTYVGDDGTLDLSINIPSHTGDNWTIFNNFTLTLYSQVDITALTNAITTAEALNAKMTVKSLTEAIATAKALLESTDQSAIDAGVTALNSAVESASSVMKARLRAAGEYKKYTALNEVINKTEQATAIEALKTVAENEEATVADVEAAEKAVTLMADYKVLSIANGTFDENINIDADGNNSGTMSSIATSAKPYIWEVDGWDTSSFTFNATASQGNTAVYGAPAANGTNGTNAPAADMYGASEGGVLAISSGWGDKAQYTQAVSFLPAGKYVFYYEGYNANNTTNALVGNYTGLTALSANAVESTGYNWIFDDHKSFTYGEWQACATGFSLTQNVEGKVSVGIVGGNGGSGSTPKMWIDNVTVYYIPAEMETYTRTAPKAGFGTICLPYAATPDENTTVYEIAGVDNVDAPTQITLSDAVESMEAGKPYIYSTTAEAATFTQTCTTKLDAPVAGANNLIGVFSSAVGAVVDGSYIVKEGVWYKVDNQASFNLGDNRAYISSFTGMTVITAESSAAKGVTMSISNGDVTAINAINANAKVNANKAVYNLNGQRVSKMSKGNLYIVDGKKVLVK